MSNISLHRRYTSGFSLIEMLIYVSFLSIVAVFIISTILPLSESYTRLQVSRSVTNSGQAALERIVRAVREAESVDEIASTFNSHPGVLVLDSGTTTTRFSVEGGRLVVEENGVDQGALTQTAATVTNAVFRYADNSRTSGVRVELTIEAQEKDIQREESFYGGAVLRGAY